MPIKSPDETVYYYECNYGKYRLTIHLPQSKLKQLIKENKIKKQIIDDYPDGIDLRVEETDYTKIQQTYGYRPETNPEKVKKIFLSFLSSTKNWRQFHGTGLIPAKEIDQKTPHQILTTTPTKHTIPPTKKINGRKIPQTDQKDLTQHRLAQKNQTKKQNQQENQLKRIKPKEIDPTQTLQNQQFQIRYTQGENITNIFTRIQHRRPKP